MNIEVKNLDFTYPAGVIALSGVTLTIKAGEQVAIVEQNGFASWRNQERSVSLANIHEMDLECARPSHVQGFARAERMHEWQGDDEDKTE